MSQSVSLHNQATGTRDWATIAFVAQDDAYLKTLEWNGQVTSSVFLSKTDFAPEVMSISPDGKFYLFELFNPIEDTYTIRFEMADNEDGIMY